MTAPAGRRREPGPLRVVLAGGGSAGHVEPALAVADALRRRDPDIAITVLGTARGLETRLVPARGYELALIPPVPVPRGPSPSLLSLPTRLSAATRVAADVLVTHKADVLVGFGGYVSAPAYLAARRARIPFVVHEANVKPGLANRLGARRTPWVATAAAGTNLRGARHIGMPLRRAIATLDRAASRAEGAKAFDLDPERVTLLAFGGSQGARRINAAVSGAAAALGAAGVQVLHIAGAGNEVDVDMAGLELKAELVAVRPARYVALDYVDRMDLAYAAADLVLCRAGMTTVAELTAVGLGAAYVPLPIGNGEQRLNAAPVVAAGGGLVVDDADCTPVWVRDQLLPLLLDGDRLRDMGTAAASLGVRDADERLVDLVLEAAGPLT